jgi:tRNA 2-selenouridine synthase
MAVRKLSASDALAQLDRFSTWIDARSESEYAEDHLPGAVNWPSLTDAERAEVGTLYKQVSPFDARKRGAALVARNIAAHIETQFASRDRGWRPLVYCWRGGKRSGAMTHILREIGWQAAQLEGGYKSYRREVLAQLETLPRTLHYRVVCGETGSAKSRLLEALEARGAQVLDLEKLAAHRGSVLGGLPGAPQPAQKLFETRVWDALRRFDADVPVFVEAESKKIGQLQVPEALILAMRASPCVRIEADVPARVTFLLEDYGHFLADPAALKGQLDCLVGLHGHETIAAWKALADRGAYAELVAALLVDHYDPAYRKSMGRNYAGLDAAPVVRPASLSPAEIARTAAEVSRLAQLETAAA